MSQRRSYNELKSFCANCGNKEDLEIHHIVPLALGGNDVLSNMVCLCRSCHSLIHFGKSSLNHSELTKIGLQKAKASGKQIGQPKGAKLTTKKSIAAKEIIRKRSKDFEGNLPDVDVIKLIGCNRGSYYKYKREMRDDK